MDGAVPMVNPALWTAASIGQLKEVQRMLEDGADIHEKGATKFWENVNKWNSSPLCEAARGAHYEIVRVLLEHGGKVSDTNPSGDTPLHLAARVVGMLHSAAGSGAEAVARILLKNGASPSATNTNGETPLHIVENLGVARLLLEYGSSVHSKDKGGRTPLHMVARTSRGLENLEVAHILLQHGADPSAKQDNGKTPLDIATTKLGWSKRCATPGRSDEYKKIEVLLREALERARRAKCFAFAMGQHARLGAGSIVMELSPDVLEMILDRA
jgi:ankyrin repeat protein